MAVWQLQWRVLTPPPHSRHLPEQQRCPHQPVQQYCLIPMARLQIPGALQLKRQPGAPQMPSAAAQRLEAPPQMRKAGTEPAPPSAAKRPPAGRQAAGAPRKQGGQRAARRQFRCRAPQRLQGTRAPGMQQCAVPEPEGDTWRVNDGPSSVDGGRCTL